MCVCRLTRRLLTYLNLTVKVDQILKCFLGQISYVIDKSPGEVFVYRPAGGLFH